MLFMPCVWAAAERLCRPLVRYLCKMLQKYEHLLFFTTYGIGNVYVSYKKIAQKHVWGTLHGWMKERRRSEGLRCPCSGCRANFYERRDDFYVAVFSTRRPEKTGRRGKKRPRRGRKFPRRGRFFPRHLFPAGRRSGKTGRYVKNITSYVKNIPSYVNFFT